MLGDLIYSLNAVLPIFLLVVVGALLKKIGGISDEFTDAADWIVFNLALPLLLFLEVSSCDLAKDFNVGLVVFLVVGVTASFILVSLLTAFLMKDKSKRGAFVQGACRSNFAILGVPLATSMFGDAGVREIAIVLPFVILMFNAYSVMVLSVFSSREDEKFSIKTQKTILKNIVTNPLIIAVLLALPFMLFEIELIPVADKTLTYLANLATPLALISLGSNFKLSALKGRLGYAIAASTLKTVILPILAVLAAVVFGMRGSSLAVVMICFGAPSAVSSYIMAKKMGNDYDLAGQILLLTTMSCIATFFMFIFILKTFDLI